MFLKGSSILEVVVASVIILAMFLIFGTYALKVLNYPTVSKIRLSASFPLYADKPGEQVLNIVSTGCTDCHVRITETKAGPEEVYVFRKKDSTMIIKYTHLVKTGNHNLIFQK